MRKLVRSARCFGLAGVLVAGLLTVSPPAEAAISVFVINVTVGNTGFGFVGPDTGLTVTGTVTIDTGAGTVMGGTLTVQGDANQFTEFALKSGTSIDFQDNETELIGLDTGRSLVGYMGGALASDSDAIFADPLGSDSESYIGYDLSGTLSPAPPLTITTSMIPPAVVGMPYFQQLMSTYGIPPYFWAVSSGRLPSGLSLNSANGEITGTPLDTFSSVVTFKVTDSHVPQESASVTLIVNVIPNTLVITTTSPLPNGQVGTAYSQTIETVAGTPPLTFALNPGNTLPPGLTLNSATGTISGTPTSAVTNFRFGVVVTDSSQPTPQTAFFPFSLTITPKTSGCVVPGIKGLRLETVC